MNILQLRRLLPVSTPKLVILVTAWTLLPSNSQIALAQTNAGVDRQGTVFDEVIR